MSGCLSGRRALVTGSTRGIGRAIALRFLAEGAIVATNSEADDDDARETRALISGIGREAAFLVADVSDPRACEALVTRAVEHLGGLDLLVNCAAFVDLSSLGESTEAFIERVLRTNLQGPLLLCRAALPHLIGAAGGGVPASVVNIGSSSGLEGHALLTAYSAAKGGLHAFTRALARELRGTGVRCNAVVPGWIENAVPADDRDSSWEAWLDYERRCPLERAGSVGEVAAVVARLASADFSYVNGQLLVVDGGAM